jgi:hypothetical protein
MPEYKHNVYLEAYGKLRVKVRKETGLSISCMDISKAIEWDRVRLLINPKAKLSQVQIELGEIPKNWRDY